MTYYGIVLNTSNLSGDVYLNFALMTAIEFPGHCLNFLADKLGRKRLFMSLMIIGGLANIATLWPIIRGEEGINFANSN